MKSLVGTISLLWKSNVVHRDIKPENVLVVKEDLSSLWITDFGSSIQVSREKGDISTLPFDGTPEYLCPEILSSGKTKNSNYPLKAMDLWSLGVTLSYLLSLVVDVDAICNQSLGKDLKGLFAFQDLNYVFRGSSEYQTFCNILKYSSLDSDSLRFEFLASFISQKRGHNNGDGPHAHQSECQMFKDAFSLLCGLLSAEPERRLGAGDSMNSLISHPFISDEHD